MRFFDGFHALHGSGPRQLLLHVGQYNGMVHAFNNQLGVYDRAEESLNEVGVRLNASFEAS